MLHKTLMIGSWRADFLFAVDGYDKDLVLDLLEQMHAPRSIMRQANLKMEYVSPNEGFEWSNPDMKWSIYVVGPTTSGKQFQNSFVHELRHLVDDIGWYLGIPLRGEPLAYMSGDTAEELAEILCRYGCEHCRMEYEFS